jgi:hypothetical protein
MGDGARKVHLKNALEERFLSGWIPTAFGLVGEVQVVVKPLVWVFPERV